MKEHGRLDLAELRREIETGSIETVITALPDLYGRLIGKRVVGEFFLEEMVSSGMHVCNYLLACDMEMDPTPGYAYTSWEQGYGDLCRSREAHFDPSSSASRETQLSGEAGVGEASRRRAKCGPLQDWLADD